MNERGHYAVGIELQVVGLHLIEAEQIDILAGLIDALFLETHSDLPRHVDPSVRRAFPVGGRKNPRKSGGDGRRTGPQSYHGKGPSRRIPVADCGVV